MALDFSLKQEPFQFEICYSLEIDRYWKRLEEEEK
jgi:hypothetical protein